MYKLSDALDGKIPLIKIPEKFHHLVDKHRDCQYCGSPVFTNLNLTVISCGNSTCPLRLTLALVKVIRALGIKGLGEATIDSYVRYANEIAIQKKDTPNPPTGIKTRTDFLRSPPPQFEEEIKEALQLPRTYAEAVQILNLPRFHTQAIKILDDVSDFAEFEAKFKTCGLSNYVRQKLGHSQDAQVAAKAIAATVLRYKTDLIAVNELFRIMPACRKNIKICITGNIINVRDENGKTVTKASYIMMLNELLAKQNCRLTLQKKTTYSTQILISDEHNTTNYFDAVSINESAGDTNPISILSSDEFLQGILEMERSADNANKSLD